MKKLNSLSAPVIQTLPCDGAANSRDRAANDNDENNRVQIVKEALTDSAGQTIHRWWVIWTPADGYQREYFFWDFINAQHRAARVQLVLELADYHAELSDRSCPTSRLFGRVSAKKN